MFNLNQIINTIAGVYQMGDMKKYIYKYDQVYGKRVDEATYRGYVLWGKPLAKQIMKIKLPFLRFQKKNIQIMINFGASHYLKEKLIKDFWTFKMM